MIVFGLVIFITDQREVMYNTLVTLIRCSGTIIRTEEVSISMIPKKISLSSLKIHLRFSRKSMDFNTLNRIKTDYFDRLRKFDVHMILGNHTTYYKNTSRINSPELLLEEYDNITIYKDVTELNIGGKDFLMLPWINSDNKEESMKAIEESDASIVCGHLEMNGFEVTPGMTFDHG